NKVVGGAIGAALAFTVLSLALWYINGFNILSEQLTTSSSLLPVIDSYTPSILTIVEQVLPFLKNMMANFEALFQQYNPTKEGESVSFS
ncbi:MAG: hypothetical protein KTR13_06030, partial [Saprospiraceae bacterium]|nr:hypothetical protein [Saprospiraceae bacterium]